MKRKKIYKILCFLISIVIVSSLFLVSASADNHDDFLVTKVSYAGSNVEFTKSVVIADSEDIPCIQYFPSVEHEAYIYHINFPTSYIKGDVVNISGSLKFSYFASSVTLMFANTKAYGLTSELKTLYDDFGQYKGLDFNITHTFSANTNCEIYFVVNYGGSLVTGWHDIKYMTVYDLNCYINNDPQVAMKEQTDELKANQDKNTDKLLNGGHSSAPYESFDNSVVDDNQAIQDDIDEKTLEARSSTISFFNNFGALLNDTPVQRGLLAVSKIFTEFLSIGWLAGLIQFGLGIGAFAFILGSVIMVVGKVSSNKAKSEAKTQRDRNTAIRNDYYKSKTAYYNSRRKK